MSLRRRQAYQLWTFATALALVGCGSEARQRNTGAAGVGDAGNDGNSGGSADPRGSGGAGPSGNHAGTVWYDDSGIILNPSNPEPESDACVGPGCNPKPTEDAGPTSVCGDGLVEGTEPCDDGNAIGGDGCSASCWLEQGYACVKTDATPNSVCHKTTCGDNNKEGFEQCDDGNLIPYDGCSPTCSIEPKCNGTGGCTGVCGDGLVFPNEECDDGNVVDGDGCSASCKMEQGIGYTCVNVPDELPKTLEIPILYRDMLYANTTTFPSPRPSGGGHPDFNVDEYNIGSVTGLVRFELGEDSEPVFGSTGGPTKQALTGATEFCWWYHEKGCDGPNSTNPYDKLVYLDAKGKPMTLTLTQTASGVNKYSYDNQNFFPIDNLGWNAGSNPQSDVALDGALDRNFAFTSELHYLFTYRSAASAAAAPVFHFAGDDDVWVFINGQLVVDLGGLHGPQTANIPLTPANSTLLGLNDGGWYSIDLFQAERHVKGSTYALELSGFEHTVTRCKPACGDGLLARAAGEQCDEGKNNIVPTDSTYGPGICTVSCTWAPYCGDGIVHKQFGEDCDGTSDCNRLCHFVAPK